MLSKLLRCSSRCKIHYLLLRKLPPKIVNARHFDLVHPTQYDIPFSWRLIPWKVVGTYWETIPLFFVVILDIFVVVVAIFWAILHKVDVVFVTHSRQCIARTMDLRNPTVSKMLVINQVYAPWPEMQDVLDKMIAAEKRALVRAQSCSLP